MSLLTGITCVLLLIFSTGLSDSGAFNQILDLTGYVLNLTVFIYFASCFYSGTGYAMTSFILPGLFYLKTFERMDKFYTIAKLLVLWGTFILLGSVTSCILIAFGVWSAEM